MKKILSLLTGMGITIVSMPTAIAANAYDKNKIIVVTNHEDCTEMAKKYIKAYPKITSPELFIITSTCEGIVNPMDSGLGGGFQMVLHTAKAPSAHYINSREKSGAIVPYQSGNTPQHIGVPSMLAGYQYLYNNLKKWGLKPAIPWDKLFTKNIALAQKGIYISDRLASVLYRVKNNQKYLKIESNKFYNTNLSKFLTHIANGKPDVQPFYTKNSLMNKMLNEELNEIGTFITSNDVANYKVTAKQALKHNVLNYTAHTSALPGGGFLQLLGTSLLAEAISKHGYLTTWNDIQKFSYKIRVLYYMYSLEPHLKSFKKKEMEVMLKRDVPMLAKEIIKKLSKPLPTNIATRIGKTKLPLSRVVNIDHNEHGTSNICISTKKSSLCTTSSINWGFGSQIYSKNFGFFYNNQLSDFTFNNIKNPNRPKRHTLPQSSMSPTVFTNKRTKNFEFAAGAAGGKKIIGATFWVLSNTIEQKLTNKKIKDYYAAQSIPRCMFKLEPNYNNVQMYLECENHLEEKYKDFLKEINAKVGYISERGYSAATFIVKNHMGYPDPRRGGTGMIF